MPRKIPLFILASSFFLSPVFAEQKHHLGDLPDPEVKAKKPEINPNEPAANSDEDTQLSNEVAEEFYQEGMKALKEGRLEQASGYFDRVLVIDPNHQGAKEGIDAVTKAQEAPKPTPTPTPVDRRAVLIKKLEKDLDKKIEAGDWEGAEGVTDQIFAIEPNHAGAQQKMGLINRKLFTKAVDRASEREAAGDFTGAYDAYQVALGYKKDPSLRPKMQALKNKIAESNKSKSDKLYIDALSANQNGNKEEAIKLCKKALSLNPQNLQAQRMMERLGAVQP